MIDVDVKRISHELNEIRGRIADIEKRLEESEAKPAEILQAIEEIWREDPETRGE